MLCECLLPWFVLTVGILTILFSCSLPCHIFFAIGGGLYSFADNVQPIRNSSFSNVPRSTVSSMKISNASSNAFFASSMVSP